MLNRSEKEDMLACSWSQGEGIQSFTIKYDASYGFFMDGLCNGEYIPF